MAEDVDFGTFKTQLESLLKGIFPNNFLCPFYADMELCTRKLNVQDTILCTRKFNDTDAFKSHIGELHKTGV